MNNGTTIEFNLAVQGRAGRTRVYPVSYTVDAYGNPFSDSEGAVPLSRDELQLLQEGHPVSIDGRLYRTA